MEPRVKRRYESPVRAARAAATRQRIVEAAAELFVANGYGPTTIRDIAERARVAVDTVYATFGSKVRILTAIVDARLAPGGERNVTQTAGARQVATLEDQREQIHAFARDIASISTRVRPIYEILRTAGAVEPSAGAVHGEMEQHRARNMRRVARWVAANGPLTMSVDRAATTIWAIASPDVARLLCDVQGWSERQYASWLGDTLCRTLLP
jgi:AcrR family transcriptional regulator